MRADARVQIGPLPLGFYVASACLFDARTAEPLRRCAHAEAEVRA
jgi:hypothetical protein